MVRKSYAWLVVGAFATFAATAAAPTMAQTATAAPATAAAPTADELVEKNIQAKGGREKIKAIQSLRMTGSMDVGQGAKAPFTIEMKRPHKMRIEFTIQGMTGIQAYDGSGGWMVMPFMGKKDPEALSADDLKGMEEQADFEGPLFDYKAKGSQVESLGKQDVDGTPAYKLKVTKKNGDVSYIYLDADAYLEIKEEGKRTIRGQELELESTSGDYKTVDGLVFPFSLGTKPKGAPSGQVITVEKIEVNPKVDDTRFAQPAPPKTEKKEGAPKPQ
jgi:outer membrane lipoprotein-sorting protein